MIANRTSVSLGRRIKRARLDKCVTQDELGQVLGVKQTTISNYECGRRRPDNETIMIISRYLDAPILKQNG